MAEKARAWNVWGVGPIALDPRDRLFVVRHDDTGQEWPTKSRALSAKSAKAVMDFANWLERSLDKQPGEECISGFKGVLDFFLLIGLSLCGCGPQVNAAPELEWS